MSKKDAADIISRRLERSTRAETAKSVLDEVMKDLENQCLQTFRNSKPNDTEGHRACRYYLRVLDDVRARFAAAISDGVVARKDLLRMKKRFSIIGK